MASAKILLNLHFNEDYHIFEHLRCDRWVLAGMIVMTEPSQSDSLLDLKDLLVIESYTKIPNLITTILRNYPERQAEICHRAELNRSAIQTSRAAQMATALLI